MSHFFHAGPVEWILIPAANHEIFDGTGAVPDQRGSDPFVHCPHDAVGAPTQMIKGATSRQHFPQYYAPTEHVALFCVVRRSENLK